MTGSAAALGLPMSVTPPPMSGSVARPVVVRAEARFLSPPELTGVPVARAIEREIAFRRLHNEAVGGSQTANKRLGAEAVDVRTPSTSGSNSDITLGTLAGGPAGAAGAVAVRGARYGFGVLGRRSDIARNDQLAAGLTTQGMSAQAFLDAVRARMAVVNNFSGAAGTNTQLLVNALMSSGGRQEPVKDRARQIGQILREAR